MIRYNRENYIKYTFNSCYLDNPLVEGRGFDVFEPERITKDVALFIVYGGWRAGNRVHFHKIMESLTAPCQVDQTNKGYIPTIDIEP